MCQLARKEEISFAKRFVRNGKLDGGVECYWILEDGSEMEGDGEKISPTEKP